MPSKEKKRREEETEAEGKSHGDSVTYQLKNCFRTLFSAHPQIFSTKNRSRQRDYTE